MEKFASLGLSRNSACETPLLGVSFLRSFSFTKKLSTRHCLIPLEGAMLPMSSMTSVLLRCASLMLIAGLFLAGSVSPKKHALSIGRGTEAMPPATSTLPSLR